MEMPAKQRNFVRQAFEVPESPMDATDRRIAAHLQAEPRLRVAELARRIGLSGPAVADRVAEVAAEQGAPPAQVALAWLLGRPGVTAPIVGATRLGHIGDALAAAELTLTAEETARLEEPYVPHPVLGHR